MIGNKSVEIPGAKFGNLSGARAAFYRPAQVSVGLERLLNYGESSKKGVIGGQTLSKASDGKMMEHSFEVFELFG